MRLIDADALIEELKWCENQSADTDERYDLIEVAERCMNMLKPCPKCGAKRYIVCENDHWFTCRDCGWSTGVHKTMDEAIKAWNGVDGCDNKCEHERAGNSDQSSETDGASP